MRSSTSAHVVRVVADARDPGRRRWECTCGGEGEPVTPKKAKIDGEQHLEAHRRGTR